MEFVSFEKLYNTEFFLSEVLAKPQYWAARGNVYNAFGKPKISQTLLWFKNCSATITDSHGNILEIAKNQLAYMAKGLEYLVEFHDTDPAQEDTVVIHFQMTDKQGRDISASPQPMICVSNVDSSLAMSIELLAQECKNNIVCVPTLYGELYKILALICQKQKRRITRDRYACIRSGIQMLEQDSAPELGFLFPAFDNRATNIYNALFYTKSAKDNHDAFVNAVFNVTPPMPAASQKTAFEALLTTTIAEECSLEVTSCVRPLICIRKAACRILC